MASAIEKIVVLTMILAASLKLLRLRRARARAKDARASAIPAMVVAVAKVVIGVPQLSLLCAAPTLQAIALTVIVANILLGQRQLWRWNRPSLLTVATHLPRRQLLKLLPLRLLRNPLLGLVV